MHVWKYQEISDLVLEIIWKQIQMKTQTQHREEHGKPIIFPSNQMAWLGPSPPPPIPDQGPYDIITPRDGLPFVYRFCCNLSPHSMMAHGQRNTLALFFP